MRKRLIIALLVTGASGIIGQILLLRELLVTFYGNELSIGIILANWLILEAAGCFFMGKKADAIKNKIGLFIGITILFSLSLPIAIYLARVLKEIIGVSPGEALGIVPLILSSFFILLVVSASHAALFTLGCKLYSLYSNQQDAQSIGRVYIYETIGTALGGVALTFLLILHLHSFQIAFSIVLLNLITSIFLMGAKTLYTRVLGGILVILLVSVSFLIFSGGADKIHIYSLNEQWRGQRVVHYQNSIYGNITVTERGGEYTFFSDGIPIITSPTPDIVAVEEFAHFPLLSHPYPREILVIGAGAGGLINEMLKHPSVQRIDYTELDPLILEVVAKFPTPLTEAEFSAPEVNIKRIDGRLFLKKTSNRYDLVLVGFSNPSDLQVNRLFTKEFFNLVKDRLKQDGLFAIRLPSLPRADIKVRELKNLNASIINTVEKVFPYLRIIPGDGLTLLLASKSEIIFDPAILTQRLKSRDIPANLMVPGYIEYRLQPWWLLNFSGSIQDGTERINQDFRPVGTFYSLSYWNALFSPYIRGVFRWLEGISLKLFLILALFLILFFLTLRLKVRRFHRISIPLSTTTTGFAGMLFDLALIFTFQTLYGYVFHWIGLLVGTFMVGVAVGGGIITSLLPRIKRVLNSFIKIEVAIILFSGIFPLIFILLHPYLDRPVIFSLLRILFLVLSFLSGLLVGAQFPLANKIYLGRDGKLGKTAGLLYGADLLGGWLGGIIGGVVLLPILGLFGTCMVIVILKVTSLIILVGGEKIVKGVSPQ